MLLGGIFVTVMLGAGIARGAVPLVISVEG